MQSELDVDPDAVERLRQRLVDERTDSVGTPSDMLRRREVCRQLRRTVGRNPGTGAELVPEAITILEAERSRHETATVDRLFGSKAHSSACRAHLLTALGSVDPAAATVRFNEAGYTGEDVVELVIDAAMDSRTSVQRAGVRALDALGWLLPDAVGTDAGRVASLLSAYASSADTVSLPALRLLRLLVGQQPDALSGHDRLAELLAAQQDRDSIRRALLTDCLVAAAEGLDLSPSVDAFRTDDPITAVLRKTVVETGGLDQLAVAEVLGYETVCRTAPSDERADTERVQSVHPADRPGAAELLGSVDALLQAHGENFVSAQAERVAASEGVAFLREAQLYGLAMLSGDMPGVLDEIAASYLETIPSHRQDRGGQAIAVGATLAGYAAPGPVRQRLLGIYRRTSGFERSVAADALGVFHCVHDVAPESPESLSEAFHQSQPGSTRQLNLAGACGHVVALSSGAESDDPREALVDRVYRAATYHDSLNPGMVGPTAVALGLLVCHDDRELEGPLEALVSRYEQREGVARQQLALAIGYYVAADAKQDVDGIEALATYISEHVGVDRGAASKALGFALAWRESEAEDPVLGLLRDRVRGSGSTEFESVRPEDAVDPARLDRNVGKAATLLGEVAVGEFATSYGPLAQAADLTTVPDDRTTRAATTVWARLVAARDERDGLDPTSHELLSLVQQGGAVGQVADAVAGVGDVRPTRDPIGELAKVLHWEDEPTMWRVAAETLATLVEREPELTPTVLDAVFPDAEPVDGGKRDVPVRDLLAGDGAAPRYLSMILDGAHRARPDLLPGLAKDVRATLPQSDLDAETRVRVVDILARSGQ
ncbi:hypothetical protein [Haloarcula sediminis]|uniref:hypothetical protein n=1 Tax=Haloarcula sediminis TaxID=3111777 RepID=UPI002D7A05FF|nr:hypothetical protein [Haloarcula sp. CK38]